MEGLKKSFGGIAALRDGRFELEAGTVHALCGGNGAGKSTFLSILMGIYRRDAGKIWRNGQEVEFSSPAEALASGIAIIEQELSPIPQMTVAENIFLGREPPGRFGGVDFRKMNAAAQRSSTISASRSQPRGACTVCRSPRRSWSRSPRR